MSCQNKNSNALNAIVRNEDFPAYKLNICKNKHCIDYNGDTLIELYPGPRRTYIQKKTLKNRCFEKSVYGKNCKILTNGYWFSEAEIGVHNYYDEKGFLKNQVDFDDGFKITINDLRKIILKEFKIDINNNVTNDVEIYKEKKIFKSIYTIKMLVNPLLRKIVKINGNSGEIISEELYDIEG